MEQKPLTSSLKASRLTNKQRLTWSKKTVDGWGTRQRKPRMSKNSSRQSYLYCKKESKQFRHHRENKWKELTSKSMPCSRKCTTTSEHLGTMNQIRRARTGKNRRGANNNRPEPIHPRCMLVLECLPHREHTTRTVTTFQWGNRDFYPTNMRRVGETIDRGAFRPSNLWPSMRTPAGINKPRPHWHRQRPPNALNPCIIY